ncbi:hypothetical protein SAMN04487792_0270 [Lactobacillus bombicola]|uniref:Uncharacterized protein n=2 Tax=Lactobacillus bombicola TaxID=1505723 RepID=A0A1I1RAA1_9LACO|nr:hypothetical protein SAMN04487792_0270 [Lactobacillus bombicola]
MTLSEAKKRANKKWDEKNKDRKKYLVYRSQAKSFIRRFATSEDLDEEKYGTLEFDKEQNCWIL